MMSAPQLLMPETQQTLTVPVELDSSLEERRVDLGSATNSGGEEAESPPRATRVHSHKISLKLNGQKVEFEKPAYSYIALISKAILSTPSKKMLLGDIYQYIMDNFPYFNYLGDKSWRNSIRHNLSLNECFVKNGRADNGKGNFWSIHAACFEDFSKGDFRRRQARRRARRSQMPAPPVNQLPLGYGYNMGYVTMTQMPVSMGFSRPRYYSHPYAAASAAASTSDAPTYLPSTPQPPQYATQHQFYQQASNMAYMQAAAASAAGFQAAPGSPSPMMTTPQIHPSWLGASGIQALKDALSGFVPAHHS